jgi:hypothetical protein
MIIAIRDGQKGYDIQYGWIDCLDGYETIRNGSSNRKLSRSAFGETSLYPLKPKIALERMVAHREQCPEKAPRSPIPNTPERRRPQDPLQEKASQRIPNTLANYSSSRLKAHPG